MGALNDNHSMKQPNRFISLLNRCRDGVTMPAIRELWLCPSRTLPRLLAFRRAAAGTAALRGRAGLVVLAAVYFILPSLVAMAADSPREKLLMDFGWKFHLGNEWGTGEQLINLGISTGPAKPGFNDSSWTSLDLPHDWAVALPFDPQADGNEGFKPRGPGFPQNNVGWYRRTFTLPKEDLGKRLWLEFGGVYRDSLVYVNGCLVGRQPRGYNSFRYDITDVANYGGRNVVAVRVDASQFEGWFYEGAGIYRHV